MYRDKENPHEFCQFNIHQIKLNIPVMREQTMNHALSIPINIMYTLSIPSSYSYRVKNLISNKYNNFPFYPSLIYIFSQFISEIPYLYRKYFVENFYYNFEYIKYSTCLSENSGYVFSCTSNKKWDVNRTENIINHFPKS